MTEKSYYHPDYPHPLAREQVGTVGTNVQKDIMRHWFHAHFEDPVENTPYEGAEGGYIYIWGGPHDAQEVLGYEFGGIVPEAIIQELVEELESECTEWSGKPDDDDLEEYYYSVIASNTDFHRTFGLNLDNIGSLLELQVADHLEQPLMKVLYANTITALETFLSDAFINTVMDDSHLIRRLVENNPDFEARKFTLNEVFLKYDSIADEVKTYLLDIIWHNLAKVKEMYKATLGIDFPADSREIFKSILIRHDIVHRNGRTKEGNELVLSKDTIRSLLAEVRRFVDYIDGQFDAE
ncbi:MAG: HEPN domain-containing protein [Desulfomonilaceae bacterium]